MAPFNPIDVKAQSEADFVVKMVMESMKLLDSYNYELKFKFLAGVISHMMLTTLKQAPEKPCSKGELHEFTKNNFVITKQNIQGAVGVGFTQSMRLYSGKNLDYNVTIAQVKDDQPKPLLN